jgi:hypothetical protein
MGRLLTVAGTLVSVIGLASFWNDLNGWRELVTDNLLGSIAVLLGLLIVVAANRVRIRVWAGWATSGDWRNICRDWLLDSEFTVKHTDDKDAIWTIIAVDPWAHEVAVWIGREEGDVISLGFACDFLSDERRRRAGESQDLAEELILEMGRHGLLFNGLKAPMTRAFMSTKIPLNALTKYRFMEAVDRVRLGMEPFAALVERAERTIQSTPDTASPQPQLRP